MKSAPTMRAVRKRDYTHVSYLALGLASLWAGFIVFRETGFKVDSGPLTGGPGVRGFMVMGPLALLAQWFLWSGVWHFLVPTLFLQGTVSSAFALWWFGSLRLRLLQMGGE